MKPSRRLGRGLEMLVPLAPAGADGRVNLDDALRGGPTASVLALSGRSIDDFVRAEPAPRPAPVPWTEPDEEPASAAAAPRQERRPESPPTPTREAPAPARSSPPTSPSRVTAPPAPLPEPSATFGDEGIEDVEFVLFDPPIGVFAEIEDAPAHLVPPPSQQRTPSPTPQPARAAPPPPPPPPAPAARPSPPPPAEPPPRAPVPNDSVFLDDEIGGIVLPDIDLE